MRDLTLPQNSSLTECVLILYLRPSGQSLGPCSMLLAMVRVVGRVGALLRLYLETFSRARQESDCCIRRNMRLLAL